MATVRLLPNFLKYSLERVLPTSLEALQRDYDALQPSRGYHRRIILQTKHPLRSQRSGGVHGVSLWPGVQRPGTHLRRVERETAGLQAQASVLDFGAGPGQTQWAVNYAFDDDGSFARPRKTRPRKIGERRHCPGRQRRNTLYLCRRVIGHAGHRQGAVPTAQALVPLHLMVSVDPRCF